MRLPPKPGLSALASLAFGLLAATAASASAESCEKVAAALNASLSPKINEAELVDVLKTLNASDSRSLPGRFVTKAQARQAGWKPGRSLWSIPTLNGKSIGGDRFSNHEGHLPGGKSWREADLDYQGEKGRNGKRIVFSSDGLRAVTVDHYNTFKTVAACQ